MRTLVPPKMPKPGQMGAHLTRQKPTKTNRQLGKSRYQAIKKLTTMSNFNSSDCGRDRGHLCKSVFLLP